MRSTKNRHSFFNDQIRNSAEAALGKRESLPAAPAGAVAKPPLNLLPLPDSVVDFLAKLSLQYGVPFEYLIADERMLPAESMRFFYVDRNWIRRSIDGAMSVGTSGTREKIFNQKFFQELYGAVDSAIPNQRAALLGESGGLGTPAPTWSGVIFRSSVVSGYPGLEIKPYIRVDTTTNPPTGKEPIEILRMDRLSDDVMLCIFNGVPGYVEFEQPAEGIHFGISRTAPGSDRFDVSLRWLGKTANPEDEAGKQISTGTGQYATATGQLRTGGQPGVIDVGQTAAAIQSGLGKARLGDGERFTSAEFAVEMVQSRGVQPYLAQAGQPKCETKTSG